MRKYSVKDLSKLAKISVRTLHHYDKIGLLKPAYRSQKKYRWYGENELLRLQQILFYKELGISLKEIAEILNESTFDKIQALESHKDVLFSKQKRISKMLNTIDKTILKLKGKKMMTDKELYEGFSKDEADKMRNEANKKFGKDIVQTSEKYLKSLSKEQFNQLKNEQKEIFKNLFALSQKTIESEDVQLEIGRHYQNIRKFWGTYGSPNSQKSEYKGLGKLYVADKRFTTIDGKEQPEFSEFLSKAMAYYVRTQL